MKVLIADDHAIFRQGLSALIGEQADMDVVGQAGDGKAAIEFARKTSPDVVIMDITMPKLNGIEAARIILREMPNVQVIALSMYANKHFVTEMLQIGALGYVLKNHYFDELLNALEAVAVNKRYLSPQIADMVVEDYINNLPTANRSPMSQLTDRERQTLQLLAEGQTIKQIALRLHISPKTADGYRRQLIEKLGFASMVDLIKFAIREGLTSLEL